MELEELRKKDFLEGVDFTSIKEAPEDKVSEVINKLIVAIGELSIVAKESDEGNDAISQVEECISGLTNTFSNRVRDLPVQKSKIEEVGKSLSDDTHQTLKTVVDQLQKIISKAELIPDVFAEIKTDEDDLEEKVLTSKARKGLDTSAFAIPETRSYPIHDEAHARAALQRVSQFGTPEEKARVRAAVKRRYPNIQQGTDKPAVKEEVKEEIFGHPVQSSLIESARLFKSGDDWDAVCIAPGLSKNRNFYSDAVLEKATGLFEGVKCFADHSDDKRSVKDLVGWFDQAAYVPGTGVTAKFHALSSRPWFSEALSEAHERGNGNLIGFSINADGIKRVGKVDGKLAYFVEDISKISSVDGVLNPSAGGRAVRLLASEQSKETEDLELLENLNLEELKAARPDLFAAIQESKDDGDGSTDKGSDKKEEKMEDKVNEDVVKLQEQIKEANEAVEEMKKLAKLAACESKLETGLSKSELPEPVADKVRQQFAGKIFEDEELDKSISLEKEVLGKLDDMRPKSYGRITAGESERDKLSKAIYGMLKGEAIEGIEPTRSLREAYARWNGQTGGYYDVDPSNILRECSDSRWSEYDPEKTGRLRESIVSSGTYATAGAFGSLLNEYMYKRLLEVYNLPWLDDWRKVVSDVVPVPDFRNQRRSRLGGYPSTATPILEGAAYYPLVSPKATEMTYSVKKYGGLEDLTFETIANDDLGAIRRIPVALARAMKSSLYKFVFNIVCGNQAMTWLGDTGVLYSSGRGTTTTPELAADSTLNDANLTAAKLLMAAQTEPDSSEVLGIRPSYIVIPPALEPTTRRLLENEFTFAGPATPATAGGYSQTDINVHRNTLQPIVVPYLTNTDSWVLLADPNDLPTVEVGFLQGRQEPELFVQDMPNVGTMFTNDKVTYKVRHIFGGAAVDHRAFWKSSTGTTP